MAKLGATSSTKALPRAKHITVENPTSTEDITFFYTDEALTITKIVAVISGSASPSLTWTLRFNADRSVTGTEVVTSGTTTDTTGGGASTGQSTTSFNNAAISANNWVWFQTTAKSGTVDKIHLSVFYD